MSVSLWYKDAEQFRARLVECDGSVARLSRESGVPRTTLVEWKQRHKIQTAAVQVGAPDAELVKQNELLKLENKSLRRHATAAAQGDLSTERVIQRIESAVAHQRPEWKPVRIPRDERGDRTAQEAVLMWSDLHAAEVVSFEETRGINEYDWDIMLGRMQRAQEAIFSHTDHYGFNISKLHIHMLGDMLSGDIHEELAITNDRPLAEAVVDLAYAHVPWLLSFADHFGGIVRLAGVPGNHPRPTKKPQMKQAHNNADWLFYQMLAALLKGHPQFEFDFPRGSFNVQMICDRWRTLLMHGDGIRTTMPGVPWGGVIRRITTLEAQFNQARQPLDFVELGHFHTQNSLDGIHARTWVNGSVKGADEYGMKNFGSGRDAEQTLLTFHPKRGWTGQYALNLQDVVPGSEGW